MISSKFKGWYSGERGDAREENADMHWLAPTRKSVGFSVPGGSFVDGAGRRQHSPPMPYLRPFVPTNTGKPEDVSGERGDARAENADMHWLAPMV